MNAAFNDCILPTSGCIGIIGGGQLGRMTAMAAKRLGYRVGILTPETNSPAEQVSDFTIQAAYDNPSALERFAQQVDVVTLEFENIPTQAIETLAKWVPVRPGAHVLSITQNRLAEKTYLAQLGLPVAPFLPVNSLHQLEAGLSQLGTPAILKTAGFGYDGKGQYRLNHAEEASVIWQQLQQAEPTATPAGFILEGFIAFVAETSLLLARSSNGATVCYDLIENQHRNHILDLSCSPLRFALPERQALQAQAEILGTTLVEAMDYVGLLCIEFFIVPPQADKASEHKPYQLVINELAPRPHNSGHLTLEAHTTSQFEQQVRAVCGLPLGCSQQRQPAAMANLLGQHWLNADQETKTPNWPALLDHQGIALHLYGKPEARPGRKMGHITTLSAQSADEALQQVQTARNAL